MGKNRIIFNTTMSEIRVALVEEGELREFFVEREDIERMVGDIYKGRVVSVHSGLHAAFVDIGAEKAAFLPLAKVLEENDFDIEGENSSSVERLPVEAGEEILVQIIKDPFGNKGARVSTNISVPGKFLVLTPRSNKVAVSRKILDKKERDRLRKIVYKYKPKDKGFIIRTAGERREEKDFKADIKNLLKLWSRIKKSALKKMKKNVPSLIHKDAELVIRLMRDLFIESIDEVVVDSRDAYKKVLRYVSMITPGMAKKVKLYRGKVPIFKAYKIQEDIDRMLNRRVKLKSGGYIVIEPTEALVTIDVNSGKSAADSVPEELALTTNIEAAEEIAKQLRLRDIGGIIVIDFIDMEQDESKSKVITTFKRKMRKDRARYKVLDISDLGLMEMTRKRVSSGISESFFDICPVCDGKGRVLSRAHLSLKIIRGLESHVKKLEGKNITIYGNPNFIEYFSTEYAEILSQFSRKNRMTVNMQKDDSLSADTIDIFDNDRLKNITQSILG
jgi:ribonuclease G